MFSSEKIEELMKECIESARMHDGGIYRPYVGALVVSAEGEIITRGTKKFVPATCRLYIHAERDALDRAGTRAYGATLMTTLEPCVRIPFRPQIFSSCVERIVEAGIRTVLIGMKDTADSVDGKGIRYLEKKGIHVELYRGSQQDMLQKLFRYRGVTDTYINPSLDVK